MELQAKLKTSMDETRLLILGAQILLGFQLNGMFQDAFDRLAAWPRLFDVLAFLLMVLSVGLLIAPAMQHRLVERGRASLRLYRAVNRFAAFALIPIAVSLGIDLSIVIQHHFGTVAGLGTGFAFSALALSVWFGWAWLRTRRDLVETSAMHAPSAKTPLHAKVEQMLTEARVMLPGAQALLGFQMAVMFTSAFEALPMLSKSLHVVALCCIALAIILLMAPAAFHRIAFGGEDSEEFHSLGTGFVIAAAIPLALGITLELYVATAKASGSAGIGLAAASAAAIVLILLWFVQPLLLREKERAP